MARAGILELGTFLLTLVTPFTSLSKALVFSV